MSMMIDNIGQNAGVVWNILNNSKSMTYEELKCISGLTDENLCAAIGWLSREGKLYFYTDQVSGQDVFSLFENFYF